MEQDECLPLASDYIDQRFNSANLSSLYHAESTSLVYILILRHGKLRTYRNVLHPSYSFRNQKTIPKSTCGGMQVAYLMLILAAAFWGGNYVVGRVLVFEVPPGFIAEARWVI